VASESTKRTQNREHGTVLGGDQLGRVKGSQQYDKRWRCNGDRTPDRRPVSDTAELRQKKVAAGDRR